MVRYQIESPTSLCANAVNLRHKNKSGAKAHFRDRDVLTEQSEKGPLSEQCETIEPQTQPIANRTNQHTKVQKNSAYDLVLATDSDLTRRFSEIR